MHYKKRFAIRKEPAYCIGVNSNKNINLDVLKIVLDATTPANLAKINVSGDFDLVPTPLTKEQAGRAKRDRIRWEAHTTGNAYILYVQNRTTNHNFRVQGFGKNVFQAVRRYYKGLENQGNWIWKCTQVIAVYECANKQCSQAGKFLFGKEQESAPW